ncbi:PAS domain S-box protein [Pseudoduganella chitinolytica]|uniref:histidine kinase n=1 Tax=Pseudoduganella chitinolytica TaxID=34070 RepID=A0ABY8BIA7_9BURK|nr:PAS domain S-box protein [Pseudoduganella chitinolytica]WEF34402.1 PAS domain S-box protein [Pseudoduganella chitinolytica]
MSFSPILPRQRLGTSLALWASASALLLTVVLVVLLGYLSTEELKRMIGTGLAERARHGAEQLDATMHERYREVRMLAGRHELSMAGVPVQVQRDTIEQLQGSYPMYAWIGLVSVDGTVRAATGELLEGIDVSKRPWFSGALQGKYVHDVHEAKLLAKLLPAQAGGPARFVDIAFPVPGEDGKPAYVLGAHLNWRWAEQIRSRIDMASNGGEQTLIVDRDGKVLSGPEGLSGSAIASPSMARARGGRPYSAEERWPDGRTYLVGAAATTGYGDYAGLGWVVLTRQETRIAYAPVRELQLRVFGVGVAVALAFSLLGWRVSRRITQPLLDAATSAAAIEQGDQHSIDVAPGSFFELAALTGAVNASLRRLQEQQKELTTMNVQLEERVAQRTGDLARSLDTVRRSEERIRTILETAQDAFVGMDSNGRITDWNPQAEQMFGWRRDEVLGKPLHEVMVPVALREAHQRGIQRFLATGEARVLGHRLELMALRRDGNEFPVEMTIGLVDVAGERSFGAFVNDISVRRRIERELESERTLLAAVLEAIDVAVAACDQAGNLTLFNRAAREIYGVPRDAVLRADWLQHCSVYLPEGTAPLPPESVPLARALSGETISGMEIVIAPPGRPVRHLLCSGHALVSAEGTRLGAVVASSDITARREAERRLADSERFLRTMADNNPALIGYVDRERVYRFANRSYGATLGVTTDDIVGHPMRDVLGEAAYAVLEPYVTQALAGQAVHFETDFQHPGWPRYFMGDYIPNVDADGTVLGFHTMVTDITDRKMAELSQARNERLAQAASRAKSEFVANVSHEIRTPMNAVLGLTHLLDSTELTPPQREYVGMIQSCGKTLVGIINDVLDFSKIEAGRIDIAALPFQLSQLVEAIATAMRASDKPLGLVVDVAPDLPAAYIGDATRLQQVVLNLVGNALKFTAEGEVVVTLARIAQHGNTSTLRIDVRDSGIGISEEQMARLFRPFEQADAGISRRFGGTGLGLAIARQLVELMGGRIAVSSVPGQGSTFTVTLPLTCAPGTPAPAPMPAGRLLVVDASAAGRAGSEHAARQLGWSVTGVADSAQASALLAEQPVDAILTGAAQAGAQQLLEQHRGLWPDHAVVLLQLTGGPDRTVPPLSHAVALARPVTAASLRGALAAPTRPALPAPREAAAGTGGLAGARILLVEDNALNQLVAKGILEPAGAVVTAVWNGQEAVDALSADPARFDLVLMDVQMPVMDGYTATRLLRTQLGVRQPILAMSAGVTAAEREQCLAAGMNDFIAKPVDVEQMMESLRQHLGRWPAMAPATPAAAPAATAFNVERLAALSAADAGQRQALVGLVERMAREAPAELARARAAWQEGDARAAASVLHALRGSVGSLGARDFAQASLQLEGALRDGREAVAVALFEDVARELNATTVAARAWLASQAPEVVEPEPAGEDQALAPPGWAHWLALLAERDLDAVTQYETLRGWLARQLAPAQGAAVAAAMAALDFDAVLAALPAALRQMSGPGQEHDMNEENQ